MTLIDFTLSNARRFYSSMGNPFGSERVNEKGSFIPWRLRVPIFVPDFCGFPCRH